MEIALTDIRTGYEGFRNILDLQTKIEQAGEQEILLDMKDLQWFDANMCSPLGAILCTAQSLNHTISVRFPAQTWPKSILQRNGFLEQFGLAKTQDRHGTTIEYRGFKEFDSALFKGYVTEHFRQGSRGLPQMTPLLLKKFRMSLFEILDNAVEHSQTELGIFACGQHFPRKERLDFSITDLGIGMRRKIQQELQLNLTAVEAIAWAMGGNTTKRGKTGGLGLKLIREFIEMNKGRIIIVSDSGYWELSNERVASCVLPRRFPGTVVTIEINTADKASYYLASELHPRDIF